MLCEVFHKLFKKIQIFMPKNLSFPLGIPRRIQKLYHLILMQIMTKPCIPPNNPYLNTTLRPFNLIPSKHKSRQNSEILQRACKSVGVWCKGKVHKEGFSLYSLWNFIINSYHSHLCKTFQFINLYQLEDGCYYRPHRLYMGFGYPFGVVIMELMGSWKGSNKGHHGGMHTLTLTIPLNCRAMSWSGSCLGISFPMCILPKFYFGDNRMDIVTSQEFE